MHRQDVPPLLEFPAELLIHIFSYLSESEQESIYQTCRLFQSLKVRKDFSLPPRVLEPALMNRHTDKNHTLEIIALSPDKKLMAGSYSKLTLEGKNRHFVEIWDLGSKKSLRIFDIEKSLITGILFLSDNKLLIATQMSGLTRFLIYDLEKGERLKHFSPREILTLKHLALLPNGNMVVSCVVSKKSFVIDAELSLQIQIWDINNGKLLKKIEVSYMDMMKPMSLAIAVLASGDIVGLIAPLGLIKIWNEEGRELKKIDVGSMHSITNVKYGLVNQKYVVFARASSSEIEIWNIETGARFRSFSTLGISKLAISNFCLSPDNKYLLAITNVSSNEGNIDKSIFHENAAICIWEIKTGLLLQTIRFNAYPVGVVQIKALEKGKLVLSMEPRPIFSKSLSEYECPNIDKVQMVAFPEESLENRPVAGSDNKEHVTKTCKI